MACSSAHAKREARDDDRARGEATRRMAAPGGRTGEGLGVGHRAAEAPATPPLRAALAARRVEHGAPAGAPPIPTEEASAVVHAPRRRVQGMGLGEVAAPRRAEDPRGMPARDGNGEAIVPAA